MKTVEEFRRRHPTGYTIIVVLTAITAAVAVAFLLGRAVGGA